MSSSYFGSLECLAGYEKARRIAIINVQRLENSLEEAHDECLRLVNRHIEEPAKHSYPIFMEREIKMKELCLKKAKVDVEMATAEYERNVELSAQLLDILIAEKKKRKEALNPAPAPEPAPGRETFEAISKEIMTKENLELANEILTKAGMPTMESVQASVIDLFDAMDADGHPEQPAPKTRRRVKK